MALRVNHALGAAEAARRLLELAARNEVRVEADPGGTSGRVSRATPLGNVVARFRADEACVEIELLERPAFLPAAMLERALGEKLEKALA